MSDSCNPTDCSPPGSFVHGIFQARISSVKFSCSVVSDSATPWIAARQASLSITNSRSSLRLMSIESVMPSSHLILCHLLLLPPSIFPSIRVFSNKPALRIRWLKYWSGLPFPSPGDLPNPGIELRSPALHADSLLTELWGKPSSFIAWRGLKFTGQSSILY